MKASVLMITYNQARFIAAAIESVLMQRAPFAYELVVGDDGSTDGTRDIVRQYAERHPDIVRPLWTDRNLGMLPNFLRCWKACRGQYIAVLEGDDYWIDPGKLAAQVEAMDRHPEWSMCFQRVRVVFDDGRPPTEHPLGPQKPVFDVRDLLQRNPVQPCGVLYRAGRLGELPARFEQLALGDWPLAILHALNGDVGFLDEVMAVYRQHGEGAWSPKPLDWQIAQADRMFDVIRPVVNRRLGTAQPMWERDARCAGNSMGEELRARARRHARLCVKAFPFRPYSWRLLLWSHLGWLGRGLAPERAARSAASDPV